MRVGSREAIWIRSASHGLAEGDRRRGPRRELVAAGGDPSGTAFANSTRFGDWAFALRGSRACARRSPGGSGREAAASAPPPPCSVLHVDTRGRSAHGRTGSARKRPTRRSAVRARRPFAPLEGGVRGGARGRPARQGPTRSRGPRAVAAIQAAKRTSESSALCCHPRPRSRCRLRVDVAPRREAPRGRSSRATAGRPINRQEPASEMAALTERRRGVPTRESHAHASSALVRNPRRSGRSC
jgi:hypothetical protein